jgi:NTE family protein
MKVGLVLGAGGNVGRAFHAGVLSALQEALGWDARDADVIVGTSAGSLDGALLRADLSPRDYYAHTVGEPLSPQGQALLRHAPPPIGGRSYPWSWSWRPASSGCLIRAARRPWSARLGMLAAAALPEGAVPLRPIDVLLRPLFKGHSWPRRPLWISAVRLRDGQRVVFGRDRGLPSVHVAEAVAASCAIPGWFSPVRIGGRRFVDGGAHSFSNGDLLERLDLDLVVVSAPMSAAPPAWRATLDGSLRAASGLRLRSEMLRTRLRTKVLALEPCLEDLKVMGTLGDAMDCDRIAPVARQVRASMIDRLQRIEGIDVLRYAGRVSLVEAL